MSKKKWKGVVPAFAVQLQPDRHRTDVGGMSEDVGDGQGRRAARAGPASDVIYGGSLRPEVVPGGPPFGAGCAGIRKIW